MIADDDGDFALEQHLPPGSHEFALGVIDSDERNWDRKLSVDVAGEYFFMVGLANLTVGENDLSGNVQPLSADERFDGDTFTDGRLAFYLKGKIQGKYLLTAQMDTTEDDLDLLDNNLDFKRRDPREVFRRLDADRFYPVYGDDSTTVSDVDTQGAYYVRLDWDKNQALWGNYHTGITGTEFAQYDRSLYGGRVVYRSNATGRYGDHRFEATGFGSEPLTAKAHNIFAATGGSVYFLRNVDVVEGSEKILVEIRRRDTQQVVDNVVLQEGRDYEIDYLQGRVILRRPLTQVANQSSPAIIKDSPLEGDDVFLVADYEFIPAGFTNDELTAGGRAHTWLTDELGFGGTYIKEGRTGTDYELKGADATVRLARGTYLKGEFAESESNQTNSGFLSIDGGLTFNTQRALAPAGQTGEAMGAELRVNLDELTTGGTRGVMQAWWKKHDAGFSATTRLDDGIETTDSGAEVDLQPTDNLALSGRYTNLEQTGRRELSTGSIQADLATTDRLTLSAELRYEEDDLAGGAAQDTEALLGGGKVDYRLSDDTHVYVAGQGVIDDEGPYEDNALGTLGVNSRVNDKLALGAEVSSGDRGEALVGKVDYAVNANTSLNLSAGVGDGAPSSVGANYRAANGQELYGTYSIDPDRTAGEKSTLTMGQRKKFGNSTQIFSEHQFIEGESESGLANTMGLDYDFSRYWHFGFSFQASSLENQANTNEIERHAATGSVHYKGDRSKISSKLEFRRDRGGRDTNQWLTSNALEWRQSPRMTWLGKLNYSFTEDEDTSIDDARFAEIDIGGAYRPVFSDGLNLLGKYTYLYDLPSAGQQTTRTDERAHIVALESIYDLTQRWELGGKVAYKMNQLRAGRDNGQWFDSSARLGVVRGRYHFVKQWDALAEYRWLSVQEAEDARHGALLGVYRHIGNNFKIGAGYNFTDFNDDLGNLDYDNEGWFVDLIGKF